MRYAHPATAALLAVAAAAPLAAQDRASVITVTTDEYAFSDAPDTVRAGLVTFEMTNAGKEPHHVWVARLDDGRTIGDLAAAMQEPGAPPEWFVSVGGPQDVMGGASSATVFLTPGNYVYICFVPAPDGVPHVAKGMVRPFTVAGDAPASPASLPPADVTVRLVDYGFEFSTPLTSGRRTLLIQNPSRQFHELVIMKLAPGKTAADVAAWVERREGPPPMQMAGGVTGIDPGLEAVISTDLEPGEYALLCFLPDKADGRPHLAHGMVTQITVK